MNSKPSPYRWIQAGDLNAFFGLMLDNVAGLILMVSLLGVAGLPSEFVVERMVPGTALGVLVGDLAFFFLAFRLARRSGRSDVTAMPLGLDTPSTFGMTLLVLGPAYRAGVEELGMSAAESAVRTWHIGIWCVVASGLIKLVLAPAGEWVRRSVPRAGLLGSLTAVALVLISFLPLTHILGHAIPGMLALVIILTTLIGRIPLPGRTPGALGALIVAGGAYYVMVFFELGDYRSPSAPPPNWLPTEWFAAWSFPWVSAFDDALPYFPVALPFAIATVVGGVDCTESAAAVGDVYDTRSVIGIEAAATLLAGLSGGVIQTTPYIGHPAYKAMGGRAAYTLGTALLVGSAGLVGYFGFLHAWIPAPVVYPILVFIGLEIAAQSFLATPRRHYPAVALACLPALALLALNIPGRIFADPFVSGQNVSPETLAGVGLVKDIQTLTMLSNGFILTSLLWAWTLASLIDRKLKVASGVLLAAACLTAVGIIHSPLATNRMFLPLGPDSLGGLVLAQELRPRMLEMVAAYAVSALSVWMLAFTPGAKKTPPATEFEGECAEPDSIAST